MINIKELIGDSSQLNAETLPLLKSIVEKYPFFQIARLLYVTNLYNLHSPDFGTELKKASVFVPDCTALFYMTEGKNYELNIEQSYKNAIETAEDSSRTMSLISNFLSSEGNAESKDAPRTQPTVADLTNDYASYLNQLDLSADTPQEETPQINGENLIKSFLEGSQHTHRYQFQNTADGEYASVESNDEEEEIYTENMVNIYIKQGRYEQALEILRKICLNNPKKSANFASQIKLLEVITNDNS